MPSKITQEWDEVYQLMSWWDSERVSNARVLVVGAGALGNEVLKNLALLNIGFIYIVDFDRIEYHNLSRSVLFRPSDVGELKAEVAAKRLTEINPNCRVGYTIGDIIYDLGLGFMRTVDVIIGCLDNRIARYYINKHAHRIDKIWVNAGILNLMGTVEAFVPGISCYECGLKPKEWEIIRTRMSCTDVAKRNANFGRLPTTPISASIIGAMQVQEALKVIYGNEKELLSEQRYFYNGQTNDSSYIPAYPLKPSCLSHESWTDIIEAKDLSAHMTVAELLAALRDRLDAEKVKIDLEYDIIFELYSSESKRSSPMVIPRFRITEELVRRHEFIVGEAIWIPRGSTTNTLDDNFPHPNLSLHELGIPYWGILKVEADGKYLEVELQGDQGYYSFTTKTNTNITNG